MKWPDPVIASFTKLKPDLRYQKLSKAFYKLRSLENQHQIKQHAVACNEILRELMHRRNFVADAGFWIELYFRQIWQYPHIESLCGVPFVNVTKHNHALSWYMQVLTNPSYDNLPIIHFDSHPDTNGIKDSHLLPKYFDEYRKTKSGQLIDKAQTLVWDIGAEISGILLTTGKRPFCWVMPEWLPDPDITKEYGIWKGKNEHKLVVHASTKSEADFLDKGAIEVTRTQTPTSLFVQVHDPLGKKGDKDALVDFCKGSDKFILDIDLDYFVCNGVAVSEAADPIEEDISSPHRIPMVEMIQEPRAVFSSINTQYVKYKRIVDAEIRLIDSRIRRFQRVLRDLKNARKSPALISISDSTGVDFTECFDCASVTNQYVSSHLALYVRTKVLKVIRDVFGSRREDQI